MRAIQNCRFTGRKSLTNSYNASTDMLQFYLQFYLKLSSDFKLLLFQELGSQVMVPEES